MKKKHARDTYTKSNVSSGPKFIELNSGSNPKASDDKQLHDHKRQRDMKRSLSERIAKEEEVSGQVRETGFGRGNLEMTFRLKKSVKELKHRHAAEQHHQERRKIRRSAGDIMKHRKVKPSFWMGKRVH